MLSEKRAVWAGVLLLAPSLVCLALTVWLDLHTDPAGVGAQYAPGWGWTYALIGAVQAALAAVILVLEHRVVRPGDLSRLGRAFFTMNAAMSATVFVFALVDRLW